MAGAPVAITITTYDLVDFARLNVRACRALWPEAPILLSDDHSAHSEQMEEMADEEGVFYQKSSGRMGHCAGDLQGLLTALAFAQAHGCLALKFSQRLVPADPFPSTLKVFDDPDCWLAQPGRPDPRQMVRPSGRFFTRFGRLTDVLAVRPERIDRENLVAFYREAAAVPATRFQLFVEIALGRYIDIHLGGHSRLIPEWTNGELGKPKMILRRNQSSTGEYVRLAESLGITSGKYPLGEWRELEKNNYQCLPLTI